MGEWQPIETAPKDEFLLFHADGMIRLGFWDGVTFGEAVFPVLIDKAGNRIISRDLETLRGERLELAMTIYVPTHWMPLPELP